MAKKPPDPDFFMNAREPSLGVGVVVKKSLDGTQTFKFASGERVFKDAYVKLYMKPAFSIPPALKAKLVPPPPRPTAVVAKSRHAKLEAQIRAHLDDRIPAEVQAALRGKLGNAEMSATRFAITESQVVAEAPDRASLTAARKVAHADKWMVLGYDARRDRVWGEYEGSDHYHVYVQFAGGRFRAGCECPSPKSPCKHAVALMLLAARQHAFPERAVPDAVVRHASSERPMYGRDEW